MTGTVGPSGVAAQPTNNAVVATEKTRRFAEAQRVIISLISPGKYSVKNRNRFTEAAQMARGRFKPVFVPKSPDGLSGSSNHRSP
jgi:hypothetical protein